MLKRRKRDWFPIVATDLFCGTLAAVILLDAVSPKITGSVGEIAFIELVSKAANGDDCTDIGRIIFFFIDAGDRLNTKDHGNSLGAKVGEDCVVQAFFPQVVTTDTPDEAAVILAESAGESAPDVIIRSSRFPNMRCLGASACIAQ